MKALLLLAALLTLSRPAVAGPLQPKQIAEDAKWMIHLDVEKLLTTQLGGQLGRQVIDRHFAKPTRDLDQWGIEFDWRDIHGLTAYGTDFDKTGNGGAVLVIDSSFDFTEALEVVIDRLAAAGSTEQPIEKLQKEPYAVYSAKGEAFGAAFNKRTFLLAKSRADLEKARSVLDGKARNLAAAKKAPKTLRETEGFLFAAVTDGFQTKAKLPPQVSGLKSAQSGQFSAGEKADKVFVSLSLDTRDAESATKMQQVLQGLLALAALSQDANQELATLVQGARVGGEENSVHVSLEIPSEAVLAKIRSSQPRRRK